MRVSSESSSVWENTQPRRRTGCFFIQHWLRASTKSMVRKAREITKFFCVLISFLEFWNDCFFCFAVRFSMYSSCSCYSMLLLFQFFFLRFSHRLHWLRFSISQSWQIEQHMSSCVFDNDYEVNASNSVDEFVKWLVKFCWNAEEWPHPGAPLRDPCLSSEYADSGLGELEPRYKAFGQKTSKKTP